MYENMLGGGGVLPEQLVYHIKGLVLIAMTQFMLSV